MSTVPVRAEHIDKLREAFLFAKEHEQDVGTYPQQLGRLYASAKELLGGAADAALAEAAGAGLRSRLTESIAHENKRLQAENARLRRELRRARLGVVTD